MLVFRRLVSVGKTQIVELPETLPLAHAHDLFTCRPIPVQDRQVKLADAMSDPAVRRDHEPVAASRCEAQRWREQTIVRSVRPQSDGDRLRAQSSKRSTSHRVKLPRFISKSEAKPANVICGRNEHQA